MSEQYEQVNVSDLEEGDTVRFAGLEWTMADRTCGDGFARFLCDAGGNRLTRLPNEATVERKVEPKTKEFLVTCEWRKPESKHEYVVLLSGLSGGTELHTANYNWDQRCWVVIKVEEQT